MNSGVVCVIAMVTVATPLARAPSPTPAWKVNSSLISLTLLTPVLTCAKTSTETSFDTHTLHPE